MHPPTFWFPRRQEVCSLFLRHRTNLIDDKVDDKVQEIVKSVNDKQGFRKIGSFHTATGRMAFPPPPPKKHLYSRSNLAGKFICNPLILVRTFFFQEAGDHGSLQKESRSVQQDSELNLGKRFLLLANSNSRVHLVLFNIRFAQNLTCHLAETKSSIGTKNKAQKSRPPKKHKKKQKRTRKCLKQKRTVHKSGCFC